MFFCQKNYSKINLTSSFGTSSIQNKIPVSTVIVEKEIWMNTNCGLFRCQFAYKTLKGIIFPHTSEMN